MCFLRTSEKHPLGRPVQKGLPRTFHPSLHMPRLLHRYSATCTRFNREKDQFYPESRRLQNQPVQTIRGHVKIVPAERGQRPRGGQSVRVHRRRRIVPRNRAEDHGEYLHRK